MTEVRFEDKGKIKSSVNIPSAWDEMTPEQIRYVFMEYEKYSKGEISFQQLKILTIYKLMGLRKPTGRALVPTAIENLARLSGMADFMFKESESGAAALTFDAIYNPLPTVYAGSRVLVGPSAACSDLTFGEFRNASMALNLFFETGEDVHLDECIAYLYRPRSYKPNKAGRCVKPVESLTFQEETQRAASLAGWQKTLIMMWFSSVIGFLQTGSLTISGETVDMAALFAAGGQSKGPAATWNDALIQISKEGSMGDIDQVDAQPLMLILLHMWVNHKEAKRYEDSSKAKKS